MDLGDLCQSFLKKRWKRQVQILQVLRRGGSRKKYLGALPLIIWEATTAKRNLSEINIEPITSTSSRTTVSKNWGGGGAGQDLGGGAVPPGPNVEPPLVLRVVR